MLVVRLLQLPDLIILKVASYMHLIKLIFQLCIGLLDSVITDDEIGLGSQISTDPITLSTPTDEGISIDLQLIILGYNHILLFFFIDLQTPAKRGRLSQWHGMCIWCTSCMHAWSTGLTLLKLCHKGTDIILCTSQSLLSCLTFILNFFSS